MAPSTIFKKPLLISTLVKDASLPIIVTAEIVLVSINPKEASLPQSVDPRKFEPWPVISQVISPVISPVIVRLVNVALSPIIVTAEIVSVCINPKEASPPESVAPRRFKNPPLISKLVKDASCPQTGVLKNKLPLVLLISVI